MQIRSYRSPDEPSVIALWQECGLVRPWNDPHKDIQRKLTVQPELFIVGTMDDGRSTNADAVAFYRSLGYAPDDAVSLGKRLIPDGER